MPQATPHHQRPTRVSVIIPVHNTRAYLAPCLDSILGQTLADIEIVCVDDCSPDDALSVLREYEQREPRVRIISLARNLGVSTARNVGLQTASGEYVAFVDSDDRLEPDFCEKLYVAAATSGADIAKGNYVYGQGGVNPAFNTKIREDKANFYIHLCSAMYRTAFLKHHGLRFPEHLIASEDLVFAFSAANQANAVTLADDARIRITMRPGSASFAPPSRAVLASHYQALAIMLETALAHRVGQTSFAYVMASLFALFFQIAGRSGDAKLQTFAAERTLHLFQAVRAAPMFDPVLFKKALDERDAMLHTCLEGKTMEPFLAALAAMRADRCRLLRSRIG